MDLDAYLDRARERAGLPSDRRLAVALGISQSGLRQYRLGLSTPQPAVMVRLAELAGVAPELALLDRMEWQADDPRSRDVVSRLREVLAASLVAMLLILLPVFPSPAGHLATISCRTRFIMEILRLWICQGKQPLNPAGA